MHQRNNIMPLGTDENEEVRTHTTVERIQRHVYLGLQWNARARSQACCAYVECGPRGQASGPACQDIPRGIRRANSQRSTKVASCRIHLAYPVSPLAIRHSTGKKEERANKMLCRFQESQQSLSKRRISIAKHGFTDRFCGRKRHVLIVEGHLWKPSGWKSPMMRATRNWLYK